VRYTGGLNAGESAVSVPVSVRFDGGSCIVLQTKTYVYYTLAYIVANPRFYDDAVMVEPMDVAAYYTAFEEFPINYAAKNFDGPTFEEIAEVCETDTRYVSKYNRTTGYAQYVPYHFINNVYYEFDIPTGVTARLHLPGGYTEVLTEGSYRFAE
jgi:hypothetical protein